MAELLVRMDGAGGENAAALTDFVNAARDWDSLAVTLETLHESSCERGTLMRVVDEETSSEDELSARFLRLMGQSRWGSAFTIVRADTA